MWPKRVSAVPLGPQDAIAGTLLVVMAIVAAWILGGQLAFTTSHLDVWFESDSEYVLDQLTNRNSDHNDTNSRHPVYPLAGFGSVWLLDALLGLDRATGAALVKIASGALFAAMAFIAMRLLGRPRGVAVLFTLIVLVSSPGILFLGVYERTVLGGASIFAAAAAAAWYRNGGQRAWPAVTATVASLGITITNFISAVPMLVASLGRTRASRAVIIGLCVVQLLALTGAVIFPNATTFPHVRVWRMSSIWSDVDEIRLRGGDWQQRSTAFWTHAIALPDPATQHKLIAEPPMRYVSYQKVGIEQRSLAGQLSLALWMTGLGASLMLTIQRRDPLERAIAAAVAVQAVLFLLFGEETVLFSPYYVPLVILLVSRAAAEWWSSRLVQAATTVFLITLALNNLPAFARAREVALTLISSTDL